MEHNRDRHAGTIRVLVADNSPFHTQLLVEALGRDHNLQAISSDLNAASLVAAASTQRIDVFVLSAFAEEDAQRGCEILRQLREAYPHRAIILLDSSKRDSVLEAFRAGARGVFDRHGSLNMLCKSICRVHEGQVWANCEQMTQLLEALASAPKVRAVDARGLNLLSKRELEVVRNLAAGLTNREIAQHLGLSQHTVKNHLFRIFDKLGVSNRIELLFLTLSQNAATPPLLQGLLNDPADGYDEATFALCQKAAEHGMVSAQLALAHMFWTGRTSDSDVFRAYMWFYVAIDRLTGTKNTVNKAMPPAQVVEAERLAREWLTNSRSKGPSSVKTSSDWGRTLAAGSSV
jgi:DNA-binding NarL/FixJ family response regulator